MKKSGFTLSELLVSMSVLAVIFIFTIPKVLASQQDGRYSTIAKEAAAAVSNAYQLYQMDHPTDANVSFTSLTPYLNYIRLDTVSQIDSEYSNMGSQGCTDNNRCYRLANGAIVMDPYTSLWGPGSGNHFGGITAKNYIYFFIDPDGRLTSPTSLTGAGKSMQFILYFNGKLTDAMNCEPGSSTSQDATAYSTWCPGPSSPPWFRWN